MECGDKSPHSKRAVIVQLHLTKAEQRRLAFLIAPISSLSIASVSPMRHYEETGNVIVGGRAGLMAAVDRGHAAIKTTNPAATTAWTVCTGTEDISNMLHP